MCARAVLRTHRRSRCSARLGAQWGAKRGHWAVACSCAELVSRPLQAVALECMRGAHRQERACYLYAFSGPRDVQAISHTPQSLFRTFLQG